MVYVDGERTSMIFKVPYNCINDYGDHVCQTLFVKY